MADIKRLKRIFWKLPISSKFKERLRLRYATIKDKHDKDVAEITVSPQVDLSKYAHQVLSLPEKRSEFYKEYVEHEYQQTDVNIIAYYLTQYHPNPQNDEWWGKGTTEWNNVSKAVPQFIDHYQPRLPGELGYYDLRVKENMQRQIELAKNYGVNVFCFYYYWFDGDRLLERPLDMFLNDTSLDMKFCICWANENWTKRFSGTNADVLMKIGDTEESCERFVCDIIGILSDDRYFCVDNRPVLIIYRPSLIVNPKRVLKYWRDVVRKRLNKELYIIAVQEKGDFRDWSSLGYDAETEFQPKHINNIATDITKNVQVIRDDFSGNIYDYQELVEKQQYVIKQNKDKKVYPAVMPMWDNTARRNNKAIVYHNSTPILYKKWLKNVINLTRENTSLDEKLIFINAWNEWGEGAYLEPDRNYGYAYLEATYMALHESEER